MRQQRHRGRTNHRLTAAAVLLAAGLATAPTPARAAQPVENERSPVYIADAPLAEEALTTVGTLLERGGADEAVRLIQRVLDEQGDRLIESERPGLFVPVRRRVHQHLLDTPELLGAYRARQSPRAGALLDQGDWRRVERDYWLTAAGAEAALRLAQTLIESARFGSGLHELAALERHPDAPAIAAAAADLAAAGASYDGSDEAWSLATRWAARAGRQPPSRVRVEPPPAREEPARSPLAWSSTPPPGASLEGVVPRALHAGELTELDPSPQRIDAPGGRPLARVELPWTLPTVSGRFVVTNDGLTVSCFDRFTLRPVWRVRTGGEPAQDGSNTRESRSRIGRIVEDSSSVTVDGDDVFAGLGLARSGADLSAARVTRIDLRTGLVRWSATLGELSPSLEGAEPRGPVIVDGDVVIVGARKNLRSRRLVALTLVGLDRESGRLLWERPVGSAGSLPFQQLTHLAEGATIGDGVVFWSDKMGLIAAVETGTGRVRWVRRTTAPDLYSRGARVPFATSMPVLAGGSLFVLTPDQSQILRLDPDSGDVLNARMAEPIGESAYLVRVGDRLACIGENRIAFYDIENFDGPPPRVVGPLDPAAIRGRVTAAGDRLAVPIESGLALVSTDPAQPVETLELETTGNAVLGPGQVIVADEAEVRSYLSWSTASGMLRDRVEAGDIGAALALAELAQRSGHPDGVLPAADAAIAIARADGPSRDLVFTTLRRLIEPGPDAPSLSAEIRGGLIDRLARVARTGEQRLAHALAQGDWRTTAGDIAGASDAYQSVLLDPMLARSIWNGGGLSVRGELEASRRLQSLAERYGSAATEGPDRLARAQADALAATDDPEPWAELARRFPAASTAPGAWHRSAEGWAARDRWASAERAARLGLRAAELAARRGDPSGEALVDALAGTLIAALVNQDRADEAPSTLSGLAARFSRAVQPLRDGRPVAIETATPDRRPSLGHAFERNDTPPVLTGSPVATSVGGDPALVLLHAPQIARLSLHRAGPSGISEVWRVDAAPLGTPALAHADRDRLIVVWPADSVNGTTVTAVAYATEDGRELWRSAIGQRLGALPPLLPDPGSREDAQIISPLDGAVANSQVLAACDGRTLVATDRRGRAMGIDASTGRELWAGALQMTRVFGLDLNAGVMGVCGAAVRDTDPNQLDIAFRGVGEAIDPRTGETLQMLDDTGADARWVRVASDGQVIFGASGSVIALDTLDGRVDWTNADETLVSSQGAWILGDAIAVQSAERRVWLLPRREGMRRATPLDTMGRGVDTGWVTLESRDRRIVAYGATGLYAYDTEGAFIAGDAISTDRAFLLTALADRHAVLIQRAAENAEGETSSGVMLVDSQTGRLLDRIDLKIPLGIRRGPSSVALADGMIIVGFNEVSVVLRVPAGEN